MNYKHGMRHSPEYAIYHQMISRCHNPKVHNYKWYGARGIEVCESWRESFQNFIRDMKTRPSEKHSIERLENNKGYCPENCVWALKIDQMKNQRSNRLLSLNGVTKHLSAWAKELNITVTTLSERLVKWSIEEALSTPKLKPYERYRKLEN